MITCRQCGAPVPAPVGRHGGRQKVFCTAACRIAWTKQDARAKKQAAKNAGAVEVERKTYPGCPREIENRRTEINQSPTLRAHLDRLRFTRQTSAPVRELLRRLELDGIRARRANAQA